MKLAVIPARGGSKRIPKKNIRNFCGKPIIAYSIEAALNSKLFDKVIVSTDDEAIAEVAKSYGAEVPFLRPATLSGDMAATVPVIKHAVEFFQAEQEVDQVCCIYATAPFVTSIMLLEAQALFEAKKDVQYVFAATEFSYPIFRSFELVDGRVKMFWPENYIARSQDLPKAYHDAGLFYWGAVDAYLREDPLFGSYSSVIKLPHYLVQDIDTEDDWARAETIYKAFYLK